MQDYDLPQIAIDKPIRLSKEVGTPIEDRPEFKYCGMSDWLWAGTRSAVASPSAAGAGSRGAVSSRNECPHASDGDELLKWLRWGELTPV